MCLSTVYLLKSEQEQELLCKNIASVLTDGDKLTFTNLMGVPTTIQGEISKIDLIDNCIYVHQNV